VNAGLKYGARGVLVTDWGDMGHQQMLAVSLAPLAYGAAAGWNLHGVGSGKLEAGSEKKRGEKKAGAGRELEDIFAGISMHLFGDPRGEFARWAYELGRVYETFSWQRFNASIDWWLFREKWEVANYVNRARPEDLSRVMDLCEGLIARFGAAELLHPDGEQVIAEFVFTAEEIIHTCRRTAVRQAWFAHRYRRGLQQDHPENPAPYKPAALPKWFGKQMGRLGKEARELRRRFEKLWLARNKRSRVEDVLAEFDRLVKEYGEY
jgi:hypothetical protein